MKAINEQVTIDTSPKDSIGGAKPEPEERPVTTRFGVEGGETVTPRPGMVALDLAHGVDASIETDVGEFQRTFEKFCGPDPRVGRRGCKYFDLEAGQRSLDRAAFHGTEEDKKLITSVYTDLALGGDTGEIYSTPEDIHAPTDAEIRMSQNGLCQKFSQGEGNLIWTFPDCHCGGPDIGQPDSWEPFDTFEARRVAEARDALFRTADVK
jgi:hypothetical protein